MLANISRYIFGSPLGLTLGSRVHGHNDLDSTLDSGLTWELLGAAAIFDKVRAPPASTILAFIERFMCGIYAKKLQERTGWDRHTLGQGY